MNAILKPASGPQGIRIWDSHSEELECTMVLSDSADVKTFCFRTVQPAWFQYAPGQFVTLEVDIDGEKHMRCYTLSSSPSRPVCLTITVKAEPTGKVSGWLHHNLKRGSRVRAHGPSGIFSVHHHPASKYIFLAGGVGITPLMSMTRWLFDQGRHTDVSFVQCARTPFRSSPYRASASSTRPRPEGTASAPPAGAACSAAAGRLSFGLLMKESSGTARE